MIIVYCSILGFIICALYEARSWGSWNFDGDSILSGLIGLLVGLVVGLGAFVIGDSIIYNTFEDKLEIEYCEPIELVSLKDSFGLEGNNYLFGGYFSEELKYVYIYNDPMRGMQAEQIEANNAYIKYLTDNTTPYLQPWRYRAPNDFVNHLFGPSAIHYTFYLPSGSVIEDTYQVDLE